MERKAYCSRHTILVAAERIRSGAYPASCPTVRTEKTQGEIDRAFRAAFEALNRSESE